MKQIIVSKPGSVSPENKELLKEAGCVLIEHNNPSEIRVINQLDGFEGDDLLDSLVDTMKKQGYTAQQEFTNIFLGKIIARRPKK